MPTRPSRFRFRQFSLRTGAILFLVVCIALGLVGRWIHDVRQRGGEQLKFIKRCESQFSRNEGFGFATYAPEANVDRFTWLVRTWVHPEYNRKFTSIEASSRFLETDPPVDLSRFFGVERIQIRFSTSSVALLMKVFEVPGVKYIFARNVVSENSERNHDWSSASKAKMLESLSLDTDDACIELLAELGKLPKLKGLSISSCRPEGVALLAAAPSLENLSFSLRFQGDPRDPLSAEELASVEQTLQHAFDELANRPQLVRVTITGRCPLTSQILAQFCAKSALKELTLKNVQLTPNGLAEIAKLQGLIKLHIDDELLKDAHLDQLQSAKQLRSILVSPNISDDAIIKLRKKLPKCEVFRN